MFLSTFVLKVKRKKKLLKAYITTCSCILKTSPRLEIIAGESLDMMSRQIHFSLVTYCFWPVKFIR